MSVNTLRNFRWRQLWNKVYACCERYTQTQATILNIYQFHLFKDIVHKLFISFCFIHYDVFVVSTFTVG